MTTDKPGAVATKAAREIRMFMYGAYPDMKHEKTRDSTIGQAAIIQAAIDEATAGHVLTGNVAKAAWTQCCKVRKERTRERDEARAALRAVEPHLDAIVCYASTMGEHEPNRIAAQVRAALLAAPEDRA